jgi:hypothetical protein
MALYKAKKVIRKSDIRKAAELERLEKVRLEELNKPKEVIEKEEKERLPTSLELNHMKKKDVIKLYEKLGIDCNVEDTRATLLRFIKDHLNL